MDAGGVDRRALAAALALLVGGGGLTGAEFPQKQQVFEGIVGLVAVGILQFDGVLDAQGRTFD